jgi:hypothetical protein
MEKINLSEEQRKVLNKYCLYLRAILGDDGIEFGYSYSLDDSFYEYPAIPLNGGWNRKDDLNYDDKGYQIVENIVSELIRSKEQEIEDIVYHTENNNERGSIRLVFEPIGKTIIFDLYVYTRYPYSTESRMSFNEISQKDMMFPPQNPTYKKLNNDEFVQSLIDSHEDFEFELQYEGYGDSGQIESDLPWEDDVLTLAYEAIDLLHGGWENNEGAEGTIYINLKNKIISINHTSYEEGEERVNIGEYQLV